MNIKYKIRNLRHWLIKKLAGDSMVILNAKINIPKEVKYQYLIKMNEFDYNAIVYNCCFGSEGEVESIIQRWKHDK